MTLPAGILPMDIILVALVIVCAITDLWRGRIYNVVTFSALAAGVTAAVSGHGPRTLSGPPVDLLESVLGLVVGFLPFFALYLVTGRGGGDVKLISAIGAIKGAGFVAYTMLYALFLGAFFGVVLTAWRGQLLPILKRVGYTILHSITPGVGPVSHLDPNGPTMTFGVAFALATLLTLAGQLCGRQLLDF